MFASCITQTCVCCSGIDLQMKSLHCLLDILTLNFGLYCSHPYGNTIIVIAFCNKIVVVDVAKTQATLLTLCRCGPKLYTSSLILTLIICAQHFL